MAGTLLMYSQEIAMNVMWSQREYDSVRTQILDGSCTDQRIHVCQSVLLHARHNTVPFSKFAFVRGEYRHYDMSSLNISNNRDWAMMIALTSAGDSLKCRLERTVESVAGEGINGDTAWGRGSLQHFCRD